MTIPTYIWPILGRRFWALGGDFLSSSSEELPNNIGLRAVYQDEIWSPKSANCAKCDKCKHAPTKKCQCGYNAFSLDYPLKAMETEFLYPTATIIGEVYGWGRVIQHQHGWRSQYSFPRRISIICTWCLYVDWVLTRTTVVVKQKNIFDSWGNGVCIEHSKDVHNEMGIFPAEKVESTLLKRYQVGRLDLHDVPIEKKVVLPKLASSEEECNEPLIGRTTRNRLQ